MLMYEEILEWLAADPRIQDLRKKAKELGVKIKRRMKKRDIMKVIREDIMKRLKESEEKRANATSNFGEVSYQNETEKLPELPQTYGKNKLVLMSVNPHWLHAYWDLSPDTIRTLELLPPGSKVVLRLHDVTCIIFDGSNSHRTFEVSVDIRFTKNYYFNVPVAGADYLVELGYKDPVGKFVPLIRSNVCKAPKDYPSSSTRERWVDLRTKKKRVFVVGDVIIKPVERAVGVSSMNVLENPSPSGGGSFMWERVKSGAGKGGV
ncbi:MAG: DUF4912 domain-containing protein [Thermotogaceae bacterium]|nr:DUF4912 domain-containing protein [Thermotogaceae bacterium]